MMQPANGTSPCVDFAQIAEDDRVHAGQRALRPAQSSLAVIFAPHSGCSMGFFRTSV